MQTVPAYTAVAARQTLQRPSPDSPPQPSRRMQWSPDVRAYVQRAFEKDNEVAGIDGNAMQEKLKVIISKAADDGLLEAIDWSTYPLPQHVIRQERGQLARPSTQNAVLTNINASISSGVALSDMAISQPSNDRKRKSSDLEMADPDSKDGIPPWKKKNTKNSLEDRITGRNKVSEKKQKKIDAMRANAIDVQADALERRRQRFGYVSPTTFSNMSSRDDTPAPLSGPLIGTCQILEKNYFRLTAPPAPDTVRPLPVLEKALDYIRKKWKSEHNYTYACDQLKSLRQDLTVQHVKNKFTVEVYESHARIALEMADLGEYNQCQTQLRALYKLKLGGNSDEFTAYRILYFIYTNNRTDMNEVLADLTPADKKQPSVHHALRVRSALAAGNYHKFFRLYTEAPCMGPWLLDMFIQRERLAALATICKAYRPDMSLRFLAKELAFQVETEDQLLEPDVQQCFEFICKQGGEHLVEQKEGNMILMTGKVGQLFGDARAALGKVDIKGQI